MTKSISIFGSTGSIGKNTIDVISKDIKSYEIISLVANSDVKTLIKQAKLLKPKFIAIADEKFYEELKDSLSNIEILCGISEIENLAKIKCDIFISAITGMNALIPTLNAIKAGSNIGLANKECLVSAGDLIIDEAIKYNSKIIPIDSEHNAIFQIFENDNADLIDEIILTASGGPFLNHNISDLHNVTKSQAIKHPNWKMGHKISVDSATMMNKSLEIIEAYRLFPVNQSQIKIIIHPESIIHGFVSYKDGSTLAMMNLPDMRIPISYAINYPKRAILDHKKLNLSEIGSFKFKEIDHKKFPAINIAYDVMKIGGNMPCIFNAANEIAVKRFLNNEIKFLDIMKIIMDVLEKSFYNKMSSIEDVLYFDKEARKIANLWT